MIAVGTMTTIMVSLPAEAEAVEGTTDGQIKVTFYTTYNSGVSVLGVALKYDTDKLNFAKRVVNHDYAYTLAGNNDANNDEQGFVVFVTAKQLNSVE